MAKHRYVVFGKFYSDLQKALTFGERTIEADNYVVNEVGAVTFYLEEDSGNTTFGVPLVKRARNIESLPPGFWVHIGEIDEESSVVNNTNIQLTD